MSRNMEQTLEEGNTKASSNSKQRNYCFTSYQGKIEYKENMTYLIQGIEICPTTGKEHIQGFVIFKNPRVINGIIKEFPGIHWEICKGTIEDNYNYCSKDKNFTEEGTKPKGKGHRSDIDNITSDIKLGMTNAEILDKHFDKALRIYRSIDWAREAFRNTKRTWEMDVRIYWGPPGSGKTRTVWEEFGDNVYPKMTGKWWDHYKGEECVLIDDFDPGNCFDVQFDFYLKLLDRYPMMVEWRCGSGHFRSKTIIFTSNFNPIEWFPDKPNRDAFFRRINKIVKFE